MDTRRRLIRLGVALLLVIVVMREAGKPTVYQTFFESPTTDWVSVDAQSASVGPSKSQQPASAQAASTPPNDASNSVDNADDTEPLGDRKWPSASRWVEQMDVATQRAWIESLMRIRNAPTDETPVWSGLTTAELGAAIEQHRNSVEDASDQGEHAEILSGLESLQAAADRGRTPLGLWKEISWWAESVLDALDDAALTRVTDGSFWNGRDSDAFYLQLARANGLASTDSTIVGTLPLLQQPEIYRGQRIGLRGTLQLAQKVEAQSNRLGIESYWKLWIIPADGGVRPTVLITPTLPTAIQNAVTESGTWNRSAAPDNPDGKIFGVGRFIKRVPYRSSIGADLAPAVIGRVVAVVGDTSKTAADNQAEPSASPETPTGIGAGGLGIISAVLFGILIAALLMRRSSVEARRSRELRNLANDRANLDLTGLGLGHDTNPPPRDDAEPASDAPT